MAYHYPIVYWNCACLIVNAGADEEIDDNKTTDYGKIATAMANMQQRGTDVAYPLINNAGFQFIPDEANDRIIYSLKAINGIGDDVVREIIKNRSYANMEDFYTRMIDTKLIKTSQMIQLIKAGAFIDLDNIDRTKTMEHFIKTRVIKPVIKLTFAQFDRMIAFNEEFPIVSEEMQIMIRHKYFKDYVLDDAFFYKAYVDPDRKKIPKCGYHDRWFKLDKDAMDFFQQYYTESSVVDVENKTFIISEKKFLKEYDALIQPFKEWMESPQAVDAYNYALFKAAWDSYAGGTISKWEMDALTIYIGEHELAHMNNDEYGVVDFFQEAEEPVVVAHYMRTITQKVNGEDVPVSKKFPIYKIVRLAGTVIDKNKDRHLVTLLTTTGVVNLKFNKGQYLYYDKQITTQKEDGTNERVESSWFTRGNKILVSGYRNGDQFKVYKYTNSVFKHTCYLINDVKANGDLTVSVERARVNEDG